MTGLVDFQVSQLLVCNIRLHVEKYKHMNLFSSVDKNLQVKVMMSGLDF